MHVHTAPDIVPRAIDDATLARALAAAGHAGAVLKSHVTATAGRAAIAEEAAPGVRMVGSVTLNHAVGGLNPHAVTALASMASGGPAIVWMPTRDADNDIRRKARDDRTPVALWDGDRPLPSLQAVLEATAEADLVLASGHLDPDESLHLFRTARIAGCRHLVATHVTAPVTPFGADRAGEAARGGAMIEICARNLFRIEAGRHEPDPVRIEEAAALILHLGASSCILSSDLGDPRLPAPLEGLSAVAVALAKAGISDADLERLLVENPARILGRE